MTPKKKAAAKKPPRPATGYSAAKAAEICGLIADGWTLRQIAAREGMPAKSTILKWLSEQPAFVDQYARAREAQADAMADELLEIADDGTNDWQERQREDGSTYAVVDHEHISRSKLRVDTRKWLMAKVAPKKYGEKVEHEHGGKVELGVGELLKAIDGRTRGLPGRG